MTRWVNAKTEQNKARSQASITNDIKAIRGAFSAAVEGS